MQKIIGVLAIGVVAIVGAFLWHKKDVERQLADRQQSVQTLSVVATFYPLEEFARSVGGGRISVKSIVPAGAEPHEYEPSAQNILSSYESQIFLLNGAGVDVWAEKIKPELEKRGIKVIQMSQLLSPLSLADEDGSHDPHFWLDPVIAKEEVNAIANALIEKDPAGAKEYGERRDVTLERLDTLDRIIASVSLPVSLIPLSPLITPSPIWASATDSHLSRFRESLLRLNLLQKD